jgi:DNA invertase Pin-like site-specific DNA recombinase
VSGKGQIEGEGYDRQEQAIRKHAAGHDLKITTVYREEGISGTTDEETRPAFQQMVADLLSNGCRTIVVESLDRLARQYDIQQRLAEYLASKKITPISANTGEDITAALMGDPMRRAMIQVQGVSSELDKNTLVAKLRKERQRQKAKDGRCEGRKAYGQHEGEQAILEQMLGLRGQGLTFDKIAATLNGEGIKTRSGGQWFGATVSKILKASAARTQGR